ncbi:MAG TPA: multicopper oxidase domain-containing protein, partial [Chthoniobacterales bacterium]
METTEQAPPAPWLIVAAAAVRAAFGVVMAVDAWLKWQPSFAAHYVGYLQNAAKAQPGWLAPWFNFWLQIVPPNADLFISATRVIETVIAVGLLLGLARRLTYSLGAVFSLLIWATAEGLGGPYTAGATNLGPALVYALVFIALILFARILGSTPYSLDYLIGRRFPLWGTWMEWAPKRIWQRTPPTLSWPHQLVAIVAIAIALLIALGTLGSAVNAAPPTPENAAAAVSPLSMASDAPIAHPAPAALPPLIGTGDSVAVTLVATDRDVEIASGVQYRAWTFNGTVPGPILHVREGQTVNVTLINHGNMGHSIDFHAAQVDPATAYRSVEPGATVQFSFVAKVPGAFIYHCGTPPVLLHIGNGMYGAIIVDPIEPL